MGYNLLVNGGYWGYNLLTNLLLTSWDIQVIGMSDYSQGIEWWLCTPPNIHIHTTDTWWIMMTFDMRTFHRCFADCLTWRSCHRNIDITHGICVSFEREDFLDNFAQSPQKKRFGNTESHCFDDKNLTLLRWSVFCCFGQVYSDAFLEKLKTDGDETWQLAMNQDLLWRLANDFCFMKRYL